MPNWTTPTSRHSSGRKAFGSEHLNLEFKSAFPLKSNKKFEIKDICKYIVGFSNEDGGLMIYGVSDDVKVPTAEFPSYVPGLAAHPALEDLSQWVKQRIHPLVMSPAIRFFQVAGQKVAVLKIPSGVNKPYCYYEPPSNAITYFKKTSGGIAELSPDEVRELHRTHIIDQATRILRAAESQGTISPDSDTAFRPGDLKKHRESVRPKLENITDFGFVEICTWPVNPGNISVNLLREFLEKHRFDFTEMLRHSQNIEMLQDGVSLGYFPKAIRQGTKSTMRTTLYKSGLVAFDAQADTFMNGDHTLHAGWLSYELQRNLQLAKALLKEHATSGVHVLMDFEHIEEFSLAVGSQWSEGHYSPHEQIHRQVDLSDIHDYNGNKRNIVMDVVRDITDEVYRIFGFAKAGPPKLWDDNGYLLYVRGLESQR